MNSYFRKDEFTCKGNCCSNDVQQELIDRLNLLRHEFGKPIIVTSGYRCPEHNKKIGGHPNSTHTRGIAADITCLDSKDLNQLYILCCKYFKAVGDGRDRKFIHVDLRDDKIRRWTYPSR